jgi:hypothetical protein
MGQSTHLPEPYREQLEAYHGIEDAPARPILAVDLGKAKFDQRKALDEYHHNSPIPTSLSGGVLSRSTKMVNARRENSVPTFPSKDRDSLSKNARDNDEAENTDLSPRTEVTADDAWEQIASGEEWIGSLPVQMYRDDIGVYIRGFPYLIGFKNKKPRVILNKILPRDSGNMGRFYANEWARPWVIAHILSSTGFNMDEVTIATMKAREEDDTKTDDDAVIGYLYRCALKTVGDLMDYGEDHDLAPDETVEPELSHQDKYVRTKVIGYDENFFLYNRLGHGDSIREVIDVFLGNRPPKGSPPDRGLSLEYSLNIDR